MRADPVCAAICIALAFSSMSVAQTAVEIDTLKAQLANQENEIANQANELQRLREALAAQKLLLNRLVPALPLASGKDTTTRLPPISDVGGTLPENRSAKTEASSPWNFRFGKFDVTPGGFLDLTSVFRSSAVGSGIATTAGAIPFPNTPAGHLTETRLSAQNSRLTLHINTQTGTTDFTSFLETDFLGFQPANGLVTANSDGPRLRLFWADLRRGHWELLAGQSYSFMTPNRAGLSPEPKDLVLTQVVDPNFHVGLTWTRAPQVRFVYHFDESWSLGVALESPQQFTGSGVTLPAQLASAYSTQVDNGSLTVPSATPNLSPDIIPKLAFDKTVGTHSLHLELVGLLSTFRVFDPLSNKHFTALGSGGSLNVDAGITRQLHALLNTFASNGGGRYISGLGPDFIIRPNGSLAPVSSGSGLVGLEYRATPKALLYGYYGGAYFQRKFDSDAPGVLSGYGFSGSSTAANRLIQEGTLGFLRTLWGKQGYGTVQINTQFSYVTRVPWSINADQSRNAHTTEVFFGLRFVAP